jgi:hypothetical protein
VFPILKNNLKFFNLLILIHLLLVSVLNSQLYKLETNNLTLVYLGKQYEYLIPHTARCFENSLKYHRNLFNYTPSGKTTVFMQDFGDYGNAGAAAIPNNYVKIGISPLDYTYETMSSNERINYIMNHELVHIVTNDKASSNDKFYRELFSGKVAVSPDDPFSMLYSYLTNPRSYTPRWYREGIAVFMDTWMAGGIGRAMGNYDEMVFRSMVRDSSYFYTLIGLESEGTAIDFQVGVNSYLYGTRFMSYLAYQYGTEKLIDWVSKIENRKKYFASDFERIYGITLDTEWAKWIEWEHQFQQENLQSIRLNPTTPYRSISDRALGSVSRGYYDKNTNRLYVAVKYPAQIPHIAAIDIETGSLSKICDITGTGLYFVTSLSLNPSKGILYFTTDNNDWRDLNAVDIQTGKTETLIKDARTGDLTFNKKDNSIWGIRHYNGISTIVRIPYPYKEWKQVHSFNYGMDMYDIDVSPDGKYLSGALAKINGDQLLIKMDIDSLLLGKSSFETLFNFENSLPANFTFSADGRYLYGSSYYSGVSNIYRYDNTTNDIVPLSNCESGFFRPVPVSEDSIIVFRYTGKGFVPTMIPIQKVERVSNIKFLGNEVVEKYPIIESWVADPPSKINIDSLTIYRGEYSSLSDVTLNSIYPIVEGYKSTAAFGLRMDMMAWPGVAGLTGKISYSPNTGLSQNERLHAALKFRYWNWEIKATYNHADFYDLFGPTKTSRKGYSLGIQYDQALIYEKPRSLDLNIRLSGYAGLDRLPFFQNVTTPVEEFITIGASLKYSYLLKTLGAVEVEKGFEAELLAHNYYAHSKLYPHLLLNANYGFLLPFDHSSLWLRSSFGISGGNRDVAFSNYYFGGFGNNWIDHQNSQRYRESYSFPGTELNSIEAQNYIKLMLEWPLPPIRFRRAGFTNLYLNWARLSLFTSGIAEDIHKKEYRSSIANIGAQIDFRLVIFYYMSSTFSIGYSAAFQEGQRSSNEFMISLKIL